MRSSQLRDTVREIRHLVEEGGGILVERDMLQVLSHTPALVIFLNYSGVGILPCGGGQDFVRLPFSEADRVVLWDKDTISISEVIQRCTADVDVRA